MYTFYSDESKHHFYFKLEQYSISNVATSYAVRIYVDAEYRFSNEIIWQLDKRKYLIGNYYPDNDLLLSCTGHVFTNDVHESVRNYFNRFRVFD